MCIYHRYTLALLVISTTSWCAESSKSSSVSSDIPQASASPTSNVLVLLKQALDRVTVNPTLPFGGTHERYMSEIQTMGKDMMEKFKTWYEAYKQSALERPALSVQWTIDIEATAARFRGDLEDRSAELTREARKAFVAKRRTSFSTLAAGFSDETRARVIHYSDGLLSNAVINIERLGRYREDVGVSIAYQSGD